VTFAGFTAVLPNFTVALAVKFVPIMITTVPPPAGPEFVLMLVTVGACAAAGAIHPPPPNNAKAQAKLAMSRHTIARPKDGRTFEISDSMPRPYFNQRSPRTCRNPQRTLNTTRPERAQAPAALVKQDSIHSPWYVHSPAALVSLVPATITSRPSPRVVSEKVAGLANAAGESGQSAHMVRDHAGELKNQADALRIQVDQFLSRVRAARSP
jgi:hypothetical protein